MYAPSFQSGGQIAESVGNRFLPALLRLNQMNVMLIRPALKFRNRKDQLPHLPAAVYLALPDPAGQRGTGYIENGGGLVEADQLQFTNITHFPHFSAF